MSGSVLEAQEAKKKAEEQAFKARQDSEKSAARIQSLEGQLHEMEAMLKKSKDQVTPPPFCLQMPCSMVFLVSEGVPIIANMSGKEDADSGPVVALLQSRILFL